MLKKRLFGLPFPYLNFYGEYPVYRVDRLLFVLKRKKFWDAQKLGSNMVLLSYRNHKVKMLMAHFICTMEEWDVWRKFYLPSFSLKGKVVLDAGAGCGETALFYLLNGASKVICIEPDREKVMLLRENIERNRWNVQVIEDVFRLEHLALPFDFMKMDIEGEEKALVGVALSKPCVLEVHSNVLLASFLLNGYRLLYCPRRFGRKGDCLITNEEVA